MNETKWHKENEFRKFDGIVGRCIWVFATTFAIVLFADFLGQLLEFISVEKIYYGLYSI